MMTRQAETGGRAGDSGAAIRLASGNFRRSIRPDRPWAPARIPAARLGGGRLTGPNPIIKIGLLAIFDDHAASRKRRPSRSRPARPYMVRFSILRRLIWPSTGPLLQPSVTAARTAS